jgi:hypothetical protein
VGIPDGVKLTWVDPATNKRLGPGKAEISTFTARSEGEIEAVTVEPMFSYEARIEKWPVDTLAWIGNHVYRVMAEIDRGEKLSSSLLIHYEVRPVATTVEALNHHLTSAARPGPSR